MEERQDSAEETKEIIFAKIDALLADEKKQPEEKKAPASAERAETGDYWWNRD